LNLGFCSEHDIQRLDHQSAFISTMSLFWPISRSWQACGRHRQYNRDGNVQHCSAPLPEGARFAAQGASDRDGAGQPAPRVTAMNNQVAAVRVDLATDIEDLPARFRAIHASSEAAKAVVKELKPVLGVDIPITGSPWLMTGLASLLGRSNLVSRFPQVGNVAISNVPGPPMTLYMAGAKMAHYFPVSIPYHGSALNITVQSYAGLLEFGLTACRRILSQDESYELIDHLRAALREIQALPSVDAVAAGHLRCWCRRTNKASRRANRSRSHSPEAPRSRPWQTSCKPARWPGQPVHDRLIPIPPEARAAATAHLGGDIFWRERICTRLLQTRHRQYWKARLTRPSSRK
jgi:hypothetical protein